MNIGSILHLACGLYLLWFLLFFCFRSYRLDFVRDQLFQVRNELFDYAATGAISFDAPAYWMLRQRLNGLLRFAHTMTFVRLVIALLVPEGWKRARVVTEKWYSELQHVTPGVRGKLLDFDRRAGQIVAKHVLTGSPILLSIAIPYIAFEKLKAFFVGTKVSVSEQAHLKLRVQIVQDEVAEQQHIDIQEYAATATA